VRLQPLGHLTLQRGAKPGRWKARNIRIDASATSARENASSWIYDGLSSPHEEGPMPLFHRLAGSPEIGDRRLLARRPHGDGRVGGPGLARPAGAGVAP
jgi:hypothetical protein